MQGLFLHTRALLVLVSYWIGCHGLFLKAHKGEDELESYASEAEESVDESMDSMKPLISLDRDLPQPFIFCALPRMGDDLWLRFLLRAAGNPSWNATEDKYVRDAFTSELGLPVGSALKDAFLRIKTEPRDKPVSLLAIRSSLAPSGAPSATEWEEEEEEVEGEDQEYAEEEEDVEEELQEEDSDATFSLKNAKPFKTTDAAFSLNNAKPLKGILVRDPVVRVLEAYVIGCRDEGEWKRCESNNPLSFGQTIAALETAMELEKVDPIFQGQVDACDLQDGYEFDVVVHSENFVVESLALIKGAGLWDSFGQSGWGLFGTAGFGESYRGDGVEKLVCGFYTPQLLARVHKLYQADFDTFGYDVHAWSKQCEQAWSAGSLLSVAMPKMQKRPLPTEVGELPLKGRSTCSPTAFEILGASGGHDLPSVPKKGLKFFLHNTGSFDFSHVVNCFFDAYGIDTSYDDWDNFLYANIAEHLGELWLIKGLETHPSRTWNEDEADLHILGVPFFTSFAVTKHKQSRHCGTFGDHLSRVRALTHDLVSLPSFQRSEGRDFFLFSTHFSVTKVFTPALLEVLDKGNVMVGTADMDYSLWKHYPGIRRFVTLPYKAHYILDKQTYDLPDEQVPTQRSVSFNFHGSMGRHNEGANRRFILDLADDLQDVDLNIAEFSQFHPNLTSQTAVSYLRSNFCLVPAGDSPTSRRLFDALAAGCTPVVFGKFDRFIANLPFKSTIDWSQILLFAGSLSCVVSDRGKTVSWLQNLADGSALQTIERMRRAGREVFLKALCYGESVGLIGSLLSELSLELSAPTA